MKFYVLKTIDYQDHALLVYGLSDLGIQSALARGVKKMNSPWRLLMQPYQLLDVALSSSKLPTIKEASLLERYPHAKDDYHKTMVHALCADIVYRNVTLDDDHARLLAFLEKTLRALETASAPYELALMFELKMLAYFGFALGFKREDEHGSFNLETLSVEPEHGSAGYDTVVFNHFRLLYYADVAQFQPLGLTPLQLRSYFELTDRLYRQHLDFKAPAKALFNL
jgi:DNA repair protein RecO